MAGAECSMDDDDDPHAADSDTTAAGPDVVDGINVCGITQHKLHENYLLYLLKM